MRFPILLAAISAVAGPALADSYRTGLGEVETEVVLPEAGAMLVSGSAVAEIAADGSVTATILVDGAPCATSTRNGVAGIALAKASCLLSGEAGARHAVRLVESHEAGDSRRSTLRARTVPDPSVPGTVLGEAAGSDDLAISVLSDRDLKLAVAGAAEVEFAACDDCMMGERAGMGSVEVVYRLGEDWGLCYQSAFNRFGGDPGAASCTIDAPAGTPLLLHMSVPVAGGAQVTGASLTVRAAE